MQDQIEAEEASDMLQKKISVIKKFFKNSEK